MYYQIRGFNGMILIVSKREAVCSFVKPKRVSVGGLFDAPITLPMKEIMSRGLSSLISNSALRCYLYCMVPQGL